MPGLFYVPMFIMRVLACVLQLFCFLQVLAQPFEDAKIAPKGWIQFENTFYLTRDQTVVSGKDTYITEVDYANSLLRYGILSSLEVRLSFIYREIKTQQKSMIFIEKGVVPLSIGTKMQVCREKGLRPEIALLTQLILPRTGHEAFDVSYLMPACYIHMQNTFSENVSLVTNTGIEWAEELPKASGMYAMSFNIALSKHWAAFIENFGTITIKIPDHSIDGGVAYQPHPSLQFESTMGYAFTKASPDYFVGIGVVWCPYLMYL